MKKTLSIYTLALFIFSCIDNTSSNNQQVEPDDDTLSIVGGSVFSLNIYIDDTLVVLPEIEICSISDSTIRFDDSTKIIWLNLFASWCVPCQLEAPITQNIYEEYKDKGLLIVGAGFDYGQPYSCTEWVDTYGLTYPVLDDSNKELYSLFAQGATPQNIIIDHNKVLRYNQPGYNGIEIHAIIEDLLAELPETGGDDDSPDDLLHGKSLDIPRYDGQNRFYKSEVLDDDKIALLGYTNTVFYGQTSTFLILDDNGNTISNNNYFPSYSPDGSEYGSPVVNVLEDFHKADDGFIFTGYYSFDCLCSFILKTDNQGNHLWDRHITTNYMGGQNASRTYSYGVTKAFDGGYLTSVEKSPGGVDSSLFSVIKTSDSGFVDWENDYYGDLDGHTGARAIIQAEGTDYLVGGSKGHPSSITDAMVFRIDSEGNEIWSKEYDQFSNVNKFIEIDDGSGRYLIIDRPNALALLDENGDIIWNVDRSNFALGNIYQNGSLYFVNGDERFWDAVPYGQEVFIVGRTEANEKTNLALYSIDIETGDLNWGKQYDLTEDGNETGHAITMNSSNELIVVGGYDGRFVLSETQYSLPDCKFFIIKFDLNGDIIEFDN